MVAKIDMHKYGSNKLRKKLNHIPDLDLSKTKVTEPIVKGKDYKPREQKAHANKEFSADREKGKIRRQSAQLEEKYD